MYAVEETFWASGGCSRSWPPTVRSCVVLDDLHWAEPTLLELVAEVVERVRRPCLVVGTARPEYVDREDAVGDGPGRTRLMLERLPADAAAAMAEQVLGGGGVDPETVARIVTASDGNPLFVEQMAAMLDEQGPGTDLDVPPTILALLAARLDRLAQPERAVLEPAAVAGLTFPRAAVSELVADADRERVPERLAAVERRRFIHSYTPIMGDPNSYQFEHILVRDAVYRRLLKRTRAQMHERFVAWADRVNGERAGEYAEITAYHLEQAHAYLAELGPLDDHGRGLGRRAGERLAGAGQRAFARGDMHAAAGLLRRAVDLMPELDPDRLGLLPDLGEALMDLGEFTEADRVLRGAMSSAEAIGDHRLRSEAGLGVLLNQLYGNEGTWGTRALHEAERAIPVFELVGDQLGLAKAWRIIGSVHATALRYGAASVAVERAIECARRAGASMQERRNMGAFTIACVYGPMPVTEAIGRCREIGDQAGATTALRALRSAHARSSRRCAATSPRRESFTEGRGTCCPRSAAASSARRRRSIRARSRCSPAIRPRPSASLVRDSELLERMGERYLLSTMNGILAQVLVAQGRHDEAAVVCDKAEVASAEDDIESQVLVESARAELHLHTGRTDEAAAATAAAVDLLRGAEAPNIVADTLVLAGRVAAARGDLAAADRELSRAVTLYRGKGNLVSEQRTVELRAALGLGPVTA